MKTTPRAENVFDGRHLAAAKAIEDNAIQDLPRLLEGLEVDAPGKNDISLMWFAILRERHQALETLVRAGSKPQAQVVQGLGTPLAYALLHTDSRFLAAMVDGGFDPNYVNEAGSPLLVSAAGADGNLASVKLLLERGAHIDATDALGRTALHRSISTFEAETAIFLIDGGARLDSVTLNGVTPAWAVHSAMTSQQSGSDLHKRLSAIADRMRSKHIEFPPPDPIQMRDWMRAQGLRVVVPVGHSR